MGRVWSRVGWSKEQDQILADQYRQGVPMAEIAREIGTHENTARSRLRVIGVERARSMTWTEKRTAALRKHVGLGLTSRAIGELLGITRNAVIGRCRRLGLTLGGARPTPTSAYKPRRVPARAKTKPGAVMAKPTVKADEDASQRNQAYQGNERPIRWPRPISRLPEVGVYGPVDIRKMGAADRALGSMSPFAAALVMSAPGQCKWPTSDGEMCGASAEMGKPYCEEHHKKATSPDQRRHRGGHMVVANLAIGVRLR